MDLEALAACPLFAGVAESELPAAVEALRPRQHEYAKDQPILRQGDPPAGIGLLLSGAALVVKEDFWGRRSVVTSVAAGDMFAEVFDCARLPELPVSVVSTTASRALFFPHRRLLEGARDSAALQTVCGTLLRVVARKNLTLLGMNGLLSRRTIRERVLGYLSQQAEERGGRSFAIPMDRQELADFLAVDRSALSAELSKMRREGLIDFRKNRFVLHAGAEE